MSIRHKPAGKRPVMRLAIAVTGLVGLAVAAAHPLGCGDSGEPKTGQAYYTVDDGATWFADDAGKIAPFDRGGKPAYQCFVWTCDGGKTQFVSHLQRYTPDAKAKLEASRGPGGSPTSGGGMKQTGMTAVAGVEVKAPKTGDAGWVKLQTPRGAQIADPKCPDGNSDDLQPVLP